MYGSFFLKFFFRRRFLLFFLFNLFDVFFCSSSACLFRFGFDCKLTEWYYIMPLKTTMSSSSLKCSFVENFHFCSFLPSLGFAFASIFKIIGSLFIYLLGLHVQYMYIVHVYDILYAVPNSKCSATTNKSYLKFHFTEIQRFRL